MSFKGFRSINPSTEEVLAEYPIVSDDVLDGTLQAALTAQKSWAITPLATRAERFQVLGRVLRAGAEEAARLATQEMGKPITQAHAELEKCAQLCDYYAAHGHLFLEPRPGTEDATRRDYVRFDPVGIVLAIMPWNFPFWQVIRWAVPTLLAGNVGLLKHASNVLGCARLLEKMFHEAGFPAGVLTSLVLSRDQVSELVSHPEIRGVSLTGSEGAGRAVAEEAGRNLKKCVLELGGSDPFVVLPDANFELAVKKGVWARCQNAGQSCIAAKRFIIHTDVYDRFVEAFTEEMQALTIGAPLLEGTQLGPMAREDLLNELHDQVVESVDQGARLVSGGKRLDRRGYFYPPTVLADVRPGMSVFEEETFGPVAAMVRAGNLEEAIGLANQSPYGLGASLWTEDLDLAERLASRIEAGSVFINEFTRSDQSLPFGGVKNSGYGRELADFGIREFVNIKSVWVTKSGGSRP